MQQLNFKTRDHKAKGSDKAHEKDKLFKGLII